MQQLSPTWHAGHTQTLPPSPLPPEPLSGPPDELLEAPLDDDEAPLEDEDAPLDEVGPPLDDPLEELPPLPEPELEPDRHASRHSSAMHPRSESPSPFSLAE